MSTVNCKCCMKPTKNPVYCSKSCAAKTNNKIPKRKKKKWKCISCENECGYRRKYCNSCIIPEDMTLQQATYKKHHKSSAFALIRSRARNTKKAKETTKCERCGYDKHVEVCHIKPISEHSLNTKISVINHESNLLILCPNCHWEQDNKKHI